MSRPKKRGAPQDPYAGSFHARRRVQERLVPTDVPVLNSTSKEPYDGADLRPFAARPGALDLLKAPSLFAGERRYRKDASW